MLEAAFWGLVTAGSLWVGAALALARPGTRWVGLAHGLRIRRADRGRRVRARARRIRDFRQSRRRGFGVGALVFYAGSWAIDRRGAHRRGMATDSAARGERERDRARDGARRSSRVVRPRSVDPAGRRRSGCRRRRRVRGERAGGALGQRRLARSGLVARAGLPNVERRRRSLGGRCDCGLRPAGRRCPRAAARSPRRSPPGRCS